MRQLPLRSARFRFPDVGRRLLGRTPWHVLAEGAARGWAELEQLRGLVQEPEQVLGLGPVRGPGSERGVDPGLERDVPDQVLVARAIGDGDWVDPYRARLDEARMKLVEMQFSAGSPRSLATLASMTS